MTLGTKSKAESLFMFLGTVALVLLGAWNNADEMARGAVPFHLILFASWLPYSTIRLLRAWGKPDPALLLPTKDRVFRISRAEEVAMPIAAIGFAVAGYGMINGAMGNFAGTEKFIGWASIIFFGLGGAVALLMRFRNPSLRIARDGIHAPNLGVPLIPWNEILGVRRGKFLRRGYVALDLRDEVAFFARHNTGLGRAAAFGRRFNLPLFSFDPGTFGTTTEELMTAIETRLRHYAADNERDAPPQVKSGDLQRDFKEL